MNKKDYRVIYQIDCLDDSTIFLYFHVHKLKG